MAIKAAFFDVDGTLSAPYYPVNGQLKIGMPDADWLIFCETRREHSYDDCRPIKRVKEYAESLRMDGVRLFVLTTSGSEGETEGKIRFIDTHYSGLFEQVIAVAHDREKTPAVLDFAEQNGLRPEETELVDDTYSILLDANNHGISCTHISYLFEEPLL